MLSNLIPGTNIEYGEDMEPFVVVKTMIKVTGGLSLSQVSKITGLQASTIQNWVKRDFVPRPVNKKYYERHLSRIMVISALRDCMNIEEIGELMHLINGDTEDTRDDIVLEENLFNYFCKIINSIDEHALNDLMIERSIRENLLNEHAENREKLTVALKVMIYAYIAGKCYEYIRENMELLRKAAES